MKNLIYIENEDSYQFETLQELYEFIFGKEYFNLSEKEKFIRRYELAFYKIKFYELDLQIVHTKMGTIGDKYKIKSENYDLKNSFIIDDEKEFVKSLCKIPNITILESKTSDIFFTAKEKKKFEGKTS